MTPELDEADRRILRCLQADPDLSVVELAERVGLSHTPCWRRLRRMEANGVITGRALLVDPDRLGYPMSIFAEIKIKNHDEETLVAFEAAVSEHPQIVECFSMSGDRDYLLRVVARGVEDYERVLKKVLLHLPGVGSVSSSFALKRLKLTTSIPID